MKPGMTPGVAVMPGCGEVVGPNCIDKAGSQRPRGVNLASAVRHVAKVGGLLLALTACAGRPIGVMEPTNHLTNGTTKVELIAATTRAPAEDKAILFTGERGTGLMIDAVTISIPPDARREIGQVQWPKRLPADPQKEFTTVAVDPIADEKEGEAWLKTHVPRSRRVLVFVHGFNNLYEEAVYRFAQIVHDSKADVVPVVFTWPSRGSLFDYNYDKESTNYSRDALEDLLTQIARNPAVGDPQRPDRSEDRQCHPRRTRSRRRCLRPAIPVL